MKIIVSGASGLVGTALVGSLEGDGHEVLRLVRRPVHGGAREALWEPSRGSLDPAVLSGAGAVINLNGRSIAAGRWSEAVKAELRSSRLESTSTIVRAIAAASEPPPLLLSASATGFYGDRGEELVDESSSAGAGFLATLARDWEAAAAAAASERTRVVLLRLGMVVAGDGGALQKMLLPFKLGLGGPIGSGRQFWPWIGVGDVVGAIRFALGAPTLSGPVNLVAPQETRCRDFTRTLGGVLGRPAFLPAPAAAVKLALGEMADALLLASTRVRPRALLEAGYTFEHPTLEEALRSVLGRGDRRSDV
jgi:uncharacterized protein (TIGR01777 family)